ncbi:MAG: hypothetical protein ACREO6_07615 [Rudaea sp.]
MRDALKRIARETERREPERTAGLLGEQKGRAARLSAIMPALPRQMGLRPLAAA